MPPPGRPTKLDDVMAAARRVFGRDGYSRASIDAIAAEAGVSSRTIYNHFAGKEHLFSDVLRTSATQVADAFLAQLAAIPHADTDATEELVAIGEALVRQSTDHPEHFAMVRQMGAEDGHFPPEAMVAWRAAGPLRVQAAVVRRLRELSRDGLLRVPNGARAARHFVALVSAETTRASYPDRDPLTPAQRRRRIEAAVDAFLHGYGC